jgi:starch-binding outer membrane protein, SusD/RagB family
VDPLKAERAIELWLEARRLWDLRRWLADGSPGEMPDMTDRSTCFPVPDSEIDRNPNIRESDLG